MIYNETNDDNDALMKVSTSTGSLSHYYNLAIIVPRAFILGADEYYAMAGGDISLVCIIEDVSFLNILIPTGGQPECSDPGAAAVRVLVPQRQDH